MNDTNYLVSIFCMTYNHSRFIKDTQDGFTAQRTTFPYVAMIIDDASTDGEDEVIYHYLRENFDLKDTTTAYEKETNCGTVMYARHKHNSNCYFAVNFSMKPKTKP